MFLFWILPKHICRDTKLWSSFNNSSFQMTSGNSTNQWECLQILRTTTIAFGQRNLRSKTSFTSFIWKLAYSVYLTLVSPSFSIFKMMNFWLYANYVNIFDITNICLYLRFCHLMFFKLMWRPPFWVARESGSWCQF